MKFRKKPVVVEATQWFKNGDHPDDAIKTIPVDSLGKKLLQSEGKIVRRYRGGTLKGGYICTGCDTVMHKHGWVDTLEGGHIVCPADWIITGVQGEHYPCKPDIFEATYEKVNGG